MDFDRRDRSVVNSVFRECPCSGCGRVCADAWLVVRGGDDRRNGVGPGNQSGSRSTRGKTWTADFEYGAAPGHQYDQAGCTEANEGSSSYDGGGATGEWWIGEWRIDDRIHSGRRASGDDHCMCAHNTDSRSKCGREERSRRWREARQLRAKANRTHRRERPGDEFLSVGDHLTCSEVGHFRCRF
jgi:hypothetical protein